MNCESKQENALTSSREDDESAQSDGDEGEQSVSEQSASLLLGQQRAEVRDDIVYLQQHEHSHRCRLHWNEIVTMDDGER